MKIDNSKISLFVTEEHHEAFIIWHYAKMKNLIGEMNSLLHFDYHPDMTLPLLKNSINNLGTSIEEIKDFTYSEIGIGNFIYPAIYQGILNKVYWFSPQKPDFQKFKNDLYVRTYKNEGKIFLSGTNIQNSVDQDKTDDRKYFEMHYLTTNEDFFDTQNCILDIDLDYFSCELYNKNNNKLEITQEEFLNFKNDRYHFARLTGSYFAEEMNSRYYLVSNLSQGFQIDAKEDITKDEISERIDKFIYFLVKNNVNPGIIEISRSQISGFTPKQHCNFIQENLIKKLSEIYLFDIFYLDDIV